MIILYNILIFLGIIIFSPLIIPLIITVDKRRQTFRPRMGWASIPKPMDKNQKVIWLHALSVGEMISAQPIIKKIKNRFIDKKIVLSASTQTGFEIANKLFLNDVDTIFFYPYDVLFSVKHIARKIDPDLVIIVESDIWPNFLFEMKRRNVPVLLVNARISKKSFDGYKRFSFFMKSVFSTFSKICTQTHEDAYRFEKLGLPQSMLSITGNIKFDQQCEPVSPAEIKKLRRAMQIAPEQKILLAGSTHPGEEAIILDAFSMLKNQISDLFLIITPRDPQRAKSVSRIFTTAGFSVALMQDLDKPDSGGKLDAVIIDRIGVLRQLYAVADLAFVGGSLVNLGGHNPLEPAACCKPVLFGPHMSNFKQIAQMLLESEGAVRIHDAKSLYQTAMMLFSNHSKSQRMGENAFAVFRANQGAAEKILNIAESFL
ncbi:MAG: 3-deoxy-D-manno-octulosonic acid transferase [Desulfobacterales bacterium]|nr:3-deoxy-D-manno-octulosonic acid transferase [Desulfobacterales bacterium]